MEEIPHEPSAYVQADGGTLDFILIASCSCGVSLRIGLSQVPPDGTVHLPCGKSTIQLDPEELKPLTRSLGETGKALDRVKDAFHKSR